MEPFWLVADRSGRPLLWLVSVAVFMLLYSKWRRHCEIRRLEKRYACDDPPRYPHRDTVVGSDLAHIRAEAMKDGKLFRLYLTQFQQYGKTFEELWMGKRLINTMDPANIQHITTVALNDYGKDPERLWAQSPFLGPSIFSDGPIWKASRAVVKPAFARAELSDLDHLASFADRFMDLVPGDGSTIDMQPLLHKLFLDVSTDFLFGKPMDSLQAKTPVECTEFLQAFAQAQRWVTRRREAGWFRFRYDYNNSWKDSYSKVHRFIDEQVQEALQVVQEDTSASSPSDAPVRRRYVLLEEMAKHISDPIALRYQILGVFMPGRDTTSILVGNILFQLAREPYYWTQLRQIALGLDHESLTFERLKSLAEFRHVINETIRLIGPAARVWRVAIRDTVLPVGGGADGKSSICVPKGTRMVMGTWCLHHDRDIWGDDVFEFRPDRWVGRKPRWEFVPFLGGARICPAQQQVLTHTTYLLVRLTQRFERIENRDTVLEWVEKFNMVPENKTGVQVAFREAR